MTRTIPNASPRRSPWIVLLAIASIGSILLTGCPQKVVTPPPAPPPVGSGSTTEVKEEVATNETTTKESGESATAETGGSEKSAPSSDATNDASATKSGDPPASEESSAEGSSSPSGATETVATESDASVSKERLLLLLPDGVMVVDLLVTLDGRPLGVSLDETLARLLTEGDANKDGRVTWDEITKQPAFQRGIYGNQPVGADNERRQMIQRYDWNRDKNVSRDELLRWLVREPHRAKPIVIDSLVGSSREASLTESPLLKTLDTNSNGQLDAAEFVASAQLLMRRDADEDETIDRSDLIMTARMPNDPPMSRTEGGSPALMLLSTKVDWENFQRTMQNVYSLGGPLGPDAWPGATELFEQLDRNADHLIGRSEWAGLHDVAARLTLDVRLAPGTDKLELKHIDSQLKEFQVESGPNSVRLNLPQGRMEILLSSVPLPDFAMQAQGVIGMFDMDKNGYLEESESAQAIESSGGSFADVDKNGDGKVYVEELAAALRARQSIVIEQLRVQAGYRDDAWWQVADADGDGRLDAREIDGLATRFKTLDRDGDGAVSRDELTTCFVLGISRGAGDGQLAALPQTRAAPVAVGDAPPWFVHMDFNGDGLITKREFLGDADTFRKLDRNGDGRLEWSELRE